MKTLALLFLFAAGAAAQDFTTPNRSVAGRTVSLQPLYYWWTNNESVILLNQRTPKKSKVAVPPRPLAHWVRVTTSQITNNGFVFTATVSIQHEPGGPRTNALVVLKNGPFETKKQIDLAAQQQREAAAAERHQRQVAAAEESRSRALFNRGAQYNEIRNAGGGRTFQNLSTDYQNASARARNSANQAQQRANNHAANQQRLNEVTKGRPHYTIDDFAMATGEIYNGLPVYSFGLAFGK